MPPSASSGETGPNFTARILRQRNRAVISAMIDTAISVSDTRQWQGRSAHECARALCHQGLLLQARNTARMGLRDPKAPI